MAMCETHADLTSIIGAMGGAVGLGNLLRFPSVVFNNYGLQFFVPYLIALFFVALPLLILEIAIGAVYRGGPVLAWHSVNKRAKGVGLAVVFNGVSKPRYSWNANAR
jgi:solute carrier family 6 GABA transporter-like protein 1